MSGTLTYLVEVGANSLRALKLTICSVEDRSNGDGLADVRRKKLNRLLNEALTQGARLSYRDLSMIMLTSRATLKRDVSYLRRIGMEIPLGKN